MESLTQARIIEEYDQETRRYHDTVTWLAEVLDGSMRTPVEYRFDGYELYANDGSPIKKIFKDAIDAAEEMPAQPSFELRRRRIEYQEYEDMLRMMRGDLPNTMLVVSDFPPELMDATVSVGGYNVQRKQTMLRAITRTSDGRLQVRSQSLDRSDPQALRQIYQAMNFEPAHGELLGQRMYVELSEEDQTFILDRLMGVYDRALSAKLGGEWYAGIKDTDGRRLNTYDFVLQNSDLVQAYLYHGGRLRDDRLTRELAAAMSLRFEGRGNWISYNPNQFDETEVMHFIRQEMQGAGQIADSEGKSFDGCGLSSKLAQSSSAEGQLGELGYGNKSDKSSSEKLVWKKGICRIDGCPTRPGQTEVAQCSICRGCQHWFDKGRDPQKMYKGMKLAARRSTTVQFGTTKQTKIEKDK